MKSVFSDTSNEAQFLKETFCMVFSYCASKIPEISDNLYAIDNAVKAGFGWKQGPFEIWDSVGVSTVNKIIEEFGFSLADWVKNVENFYIIEGEKKLFYEKSTSKHVEIPQREGILLLPHTKENNVVWENEFVTLWDIGNGVVNFQVHTKMNSLSSGVMNSLVHCLTLVEKDFEGMTVYSDGSNFSAGANLSELYTAILEDEYDDINIFIAAFQNAVSAVRYAPFPVVAATSGLALGGGCELAMHCDERVGHTETYIGLVEVGVGLIPAGCGTKEFVVKANQRFDKGDVEINVLSQLFETIAMAKVSSSSHEAKKLRYFSECDTLVSNKKRILSVAKERVLSLSKTYTPPHKNNKIRVLGETGRATLEAGITGMLYGKYISEHDAKIARKIAYVMNGGSVSAPSYVSEKYLLDLEREAFLSLCGERKTQERIHSILFKRKPLRN